MNLVRKAELTRAALLIHNNSFISKDFPRQRKKPGGIIRSIHLYGFFIGVKAFHVFATIGLVFSYSTKKTALPCI